MGRMRMDLVRELLENSSYSAREINLLWDMLFPDLAARKPKELEPKLYAISQAIAWPTETPVHLRFPPDGKFVGDTDGYRLGFSEGQKEVLNYIDRYGD